MTEEDRPLPVRGVKPVRLSWKTRAIKNDNATGTIDRGSFYTILPKGQVRQLGWHEQMLLESRIVGNQLILTPAAQEDGKDTSRLQKTDRLIVPIDEVICGDALEVLHRIPDGSVQFAVTSPPYNVGVDYDIYNDKRAYDHYRDALRPIWRETYRVLCRGGRFALEVAPTGIADYVPLHHDLCNDIRSEGFEPRAEILWAKQNMSSRRTAWGSFRSPRHPHVIPSWEYVHVFHKQSWKLEGDPKNADIRSEDFVDWSDGVWRIPPETAGYGTHPAPFPEELIRRLLLFFTYRGNTVLDMFGGTGTVAVVARKTGRHFIHIEISPDYCKVAEARLRALDKLPIGSKKAKNRAGSFSAVGHGPSARSEA